MELQEFLRKGNLRRVTADIYVGSFGAYYRLSYWSEDWQDKIKSQPSSPLPGKNEVLLLPLGGKKETYKLYEDARAVDFLSLRKIPEEDIKKLRRQLEDYLRKGNLETILAAAEAAGMNTGKFVKFPDLFEKE